MSHLAHLSRHNVHQLWSQTCRVILLTLFLKLADTFEHISNVGFEDFYSGDISRELVSTIKNAGGHATLQDSTNYSLIVDNIFNFKYKNITEFNFFLKN